MKKATLVVAVLLASSMQALAQGGFCKYSAETARCVPAEIDAAITQEYLAFVDTSATCIADTVASADGLMLIGCGADSPECATAYFYASEEDPQATQALCLPTNYTTSMPLADFLELSDAYTLCSDAESVTAACLEVREAYYGALGCDFCGAAEQALLVGFSACEEFARPEDCAAARPRGLEALPEESVVTRVEEDEREPDVFITEMVEEDRFSIRQRRPRRPRPADPPRIRRQRPTDPPRTRRSRRPRPIDPPRVRGG